MTTQTQRIGKTIKETRLEGVIDEFRTPTECIVEMEVDGKIERRIMDRRFLREYGVVEEGQAFELCVREYEFGGKTETEAYILLHEESKDIVTEKVRPEAIR